jgi:hypothetical protein
MAKQADERNLTMSDANELDAIRARHVEDKAFCVVMRMEHPPQIQDIATLIRLLDAARAELDKEQVSHLKTRAKLTGIREASELIAGPVAWLDSWAKHVSNCKGGYSCTCGLVLARQEALGALEALTRAQGES